MKQQPRSPSLSDVLRLAVQSALADVHVSLPGRIDSYNATRQVADVKPLLKRPLVAADGTELEAESLPILHDVPVAFPRGGQGTGAFFVSWPLEAGDLVHLIFCERSLDQYLSLAGDESTPLDFRTHDLSDAVAYPGFYPAPLALVDASTDTAAFGRSGGLQLHITADDVAELRLGGVADVSACIAETLQAWWDSQVKPRLDAFDAHVHVSATPGNPTGPPSPVVAAPTMDAAVASDKLRLKGN